ncbi:hypothetical protein F5Y15DRAFT_304462 [Xylariaceae sp. FL0016]|nr:hypothetical protein F5Y15DRAFT_304462 [Xylariaceae sp. FL0016]
MSQNSRSAPAPSFAPSSMAITNPQLIWSTVQEQKAIDAASKNKKLADPSSNMQSSAASTYSQSTTYSYDKDPKAAPKPKPSIGQRIKGVFQDMGGSPTARYDREHGRDSRNEGDAGPMNSSPLTRSGRT